MLWKVDTLKVVRSGVREVSERRICVDLSHDHYFFSEKVSLDISKTPPEIFLPCLTVTGYALEVCITDQHDFRGSSIRVVSDFESGKHFRWIG